MMRIASARHSILLVFLLSWVGGNAQSITNVIAQFDGEKVIISYDLVSRHADDRYAIQVFSSNDNFSQPLSLLVGDAGESVQPGTNRRLTWDARSSLPESFDQDIIFKLRGSLVVSQNHPMRLEMKPLDFHAYKRGGILNMEWNGGRAGEPLTVELLRNNQVVDKITEVENSNLYSWSIPRKQKPGKDYTLRISKASDSGIQSESATFEIKPRLALWVKLLPVVVVGGVVAILAAGDEEPDLPGAPSPDG